MQRDITLYQFSISHFCEKARWALDYKGLSYKTKNLLPGMHLKPVRKLAPKSSVPLLLHQDSIIQGSADIISYLDTTFPQKPLTPTQSAEKAEAAHWEAFADEQLGPHVRRVSYHVLLNFPDAVIPRMAQGGPWYGALLLKRIFPTLQQRMRALMKLNDDTNRESIEIIDRAVDKIKLRLEGRRYLVGQQFSRADLAVAALLGPLCRPDRFDESDYPVPPAFTALRQRYHDQLPWAAAIYEQYR